MCIPKLRYLLNRVGNKKVWVWDKSLALNIKSEQNESSDTQNSVLFAFLFNLSIFKIYNKEFLKSKSFCPRLIKWITEIKKREKQTNSLLMYIISS